MNGIYRSVKMKKKHNLLKRVLYRAIYGKNYAFHRKIATRRRFHKQFYSRSNPRCVNQKRCVIFICDGKRISGGLSDRLRGISAVYQICKEMGLDFRIHFTHPFELQRAFVPNLVDWRIDVEDICDNPKDSMVFDYRVSRDYEYPAEVQRALIREMLSKPFRQIHVFTNMDNTYMDGSYSELFHELFKESDEMTQYLAPHLDVLGDEYINVATRFCTSLGDLTDVQIAQELSEEQRVELIDRCIAQIESIHSKYPDKKIFITSDSSRFIEATKGLDYTYSISGDRVNIDRDGTTDFDVLKNSVIDFLLISKAQRVLQLKTDAMYGGFFSMSASFVNKIPFERVEF